MKTEAAARGREVEIFGRQYLIASDDAGVDVQQVAGYVDEKMRRVDERFPEQHRAQHVAVLAALEIAAELLQARQESDQLIQKTYDSIDRLRELIDQRSTLLPLTSEWMEKQVAEQSY